MINSVVNLRTVGCDTYKQVLDLHLEATTFKNEK